MNKILITGYRHFYTLDNITYPKKYIVTSEKAIKYIISRNEYKNVFWTLSLLSLIIKNININLFEELLINLLRFKVKRYNLKAFASFTPNGKLENLLLNQVKSLKSVQIAHGNFFAMNPKFKAYEKKYKKWDYLFLWSEQQKENVISVDPEKSNRIFVIGRPQETLKGNVNSDGVLIKNQILFIGNPLMRSDFDVYAQRQKRFFEIMKWANENNIRFFYKPHPAEFKFKNRTSLKLAKASGMTVMKKNITENEIAEKFDIAITIASSYGQELRLYGIHVIQYDFERYIEDFDYDLTRCGVEYKCESIDKFENIYREIVNDNIKRKPLNSYFLASQDYLGYPVNEAIKIIFNK